MINRELNPRETEILHMIRPTTFQDVVDEVRKEVDQSRFNAKRELKNLRNGNGNGAENGNGNGNGKENNGNSIDKKDNINGELNT